MANQTFPASCIIMRFLLPWKTQMIKRVYVCHFQESLLQFKWFMHPSFTKRKTTSLLFALLKASSVQLIILLSGKKGEFISNSLIFSVGNSYGIIKIPYLTSRETAAALIFSSFLARAGGRENVGHMLVFSCHVANFRRNGQKWSESDKNIPLSLLLASEQ